MWRDETELLPFFINLKNHLQKNDSIKQAGWSWCDVFMYVCVFCIFYFWKIVLLLSIYWFWYLIILQQHTHCFGIRFSSSSQLILLQIKNKIAFVVFLKEQWRWPVTTFGIILLVPTCASYQQLLYYFRDDKPSELVFSSFFSFSSMNSLLSVSIMFLVISSVHQQTCAFDSTPTFFLFLVHPKVYHLTIYWVPSSHHLHSIFLVILSLCL